MDMTQMMSANRARVRPSLALSASLIGLRSSGVVLPPAPTSDPIPNWVCGLKAYARAASLLRVGMPG